MQKLLVVEDDSELGSLYQSRLEAEGYVVKRAVNCIEALQQVKQEKPDVVVIDPHLGQFLKDAKGVWTLCKIKEVDRKIPVVIYTEFPEVKNDFRYDQADKYVRKSPDLSPLCQAIYEVLHQEEEEEFCT